jgi:hypothetical protein
VPLSRSGSVTWIVRRDVTGVYIAGEPPTPSGSGSVRSSAGRGGPSKAGHLRERIGTLVVRRCRSWRSWHRHSELPPHPDRAASPDHRPPVVGIRDSPSGIGFFDVVVLYCRYTPADERPIVRTGSVMRAAGRACPTHNRSAEAILGPARLSRHPNPPRRCPRPTSGDAVIRPGVTANRGDKQQRVVIDARAPDIVVGRCSSRRCHGAAVDLPHHRRR